MKTLLTVLALAGGMALSAGSAAVAAPIGNPGSGAALNVQSMLAPAQYYRGRPRYRRACYYVRRCTGYYPYQRCWRERVCR